MRKNDSDPNFTLNTKINDRWSADLNANGRTINLLEENIREHICDHGVGTDFLNKIHKMLIIKEKLVN